MHCVVQALQGRCGVRSCARKRVYFIFTSSGTAVVDVSFIHKTYSDRLKIKRRLCSWETVIPDNGL